LSDDRISPGALVYSLLTTAWFAILDSGHLDSQADALGRY
jgi:hypothetical protein